MFFQKDWSEALRVPNRGKDRDPGLLSGRSLWQPQATGEWHGRTDNVARATAGRERSGRYFFQSLPTAGQIRSVWLPGQPARTPILMAGRRTGNLGYFGNPRSFLLHPPRPASPPTRPASPSGRRGGGTLKTCRKPPVAAVESPLPPHCFTTRVQRPSPGSGWKKGSPGLPGQFNPPVITAAPPCPGIRRQSGFPSAAPEFDSRRRPANAAVPIASHLRRRSPTRPDRSR